MATDNLAEIKKLIQEGRLDEAESKINEEKEEPEVLLLKARLAHDKGDYDPQIQYGVRLLSLKNLNLALTFSAIYWTSWGMFRKGNYENAFSLASDGYDKLNDLNPDKRDNLQSEEALILKSLGSISNEMGNIEISLEYKKKGLELAKKLNDILLISAFQNNIGRLYYQIGNYTQGL